MATLQMRYLIPAFLLTLVVCIFRSLRWQLLFSQNKKVRIESLFSVIMIGFLANNVLPARLGEVVMTYLIGKKEDISKSLAFGTILLDRILDVTTLLLFLTGAILLTSFPPWVKRLALTGAILVLFSLLATWLAVRNKDAFLKALRFCLQPLQSSLRQKIPQMLSQFVDGLSVVNSGSIVFRAIAVSIMVWSVLSFGVYLLFLSFDFPLGLAAALTVIAIVNLGLIIPSAPGFLGTFQFFCVAALGLFQIKESQALGFSIMYHLSQFLPTTLVGFYFLNKENLSLSSFTLGQKTSALSKETPQ